MIEPAQLDPKIPTRSVDFDEALGLLALSDEQPRTYTELLNRALEQGTIVDRKGKNLKKSSFHRNWKTLETLGLIHKQGQFHLPTGLGRTVLFSFRREGSDVGSDTGRLLRQAMLSSELARQNFFALFATERTREPLEYPAALALLPAKNVETTQTKNRLYQIQNIATKCIYNLSYRQVIGIIWGLGGWAIKIGLADQLYARPQDGIDLALSKIVFLVNPDRPMEEITGLFTEEIENLINQREPVYGNTVRLPISWLFYQICPSVQVTASVARQELIRWLGLNENRAFVEGASQPVIKNVRRRAGSGARISWQRQEPALLEMDGRYYTYLFCQKKDIA